MAERFRQIRRRGGVGVPRSLVDGKPWREGFRYCRPAVLPGDLRQNARITFMQKAVSYGSTDQLDGHMALKRTDNVGIVVEVTCP